MTDLRRAGAVAAFAAGFLLALAGFAHADITDPQAPFVPYKPDSSLPHVGSAVAHPSVPGPDMTGAGDTQAAQPAPAPSPDEQNPPLAAEQTGQAEAEEATVPTPMPTPLALVPSTPAPEQVVMRAVRPVVREELEGVTSGPAGPLERAAIAVKHRMNDFGTFLDQAARACQVGVASGSGGPFLLFAVLGTLTALTRRRFFGARSVADEDAPELLYAWDVIAPG